MEMTSGQAGKKATAVSLLLLLGAGLACRDALTSPPPPPPPPRPTSVLVSPTAAVLSALGDTLRFSAVVQDQYGVEMLGAAVAWSSSDPAIATVSAGLVTAVANGNASISATVGSVPPASADVTVRQSVDSIHAASGDGQQADVGTPLPLPVVVRVEDSGGSAIADATVDFETAEGGSTNPRSAATDSLGLTSTTWTLGPASGTQTLRATAAGTSVELHAVALDPRPEVRITSGRAAVTEGSGPLAVTVEVSPPPDAPLAVHYAIREDSDPTTAHADTADYVDRTGGTIEFTEPTALIDLVILDDERVEHPRETFVVTLVPSDDEYRIAPDQGSVVVEILEGVCDRTPAVAAAILSEAERQDCHQITSHDLGALSPHVWLRPTSPDRDRPFHGFKEGDFDGLVSVRRLHIDGSDLFSAARTDTMHLPPRLFEDLEQLEHLTIVNTNLRTLPESLLAPVSSRLQELDLWQNDFTVLPRDLLRGMHQLERLGLNSNPELRSLPTGLFDDLTSLIEMDLSCNRVTNACLRELSPHLFANLGSLTTLDLHRNALTVLRGDALTGLTSLEELDLSQNLLDDLPDGLLAGTAVETFYVSGNPGAPFSFVVDLVRVDDESNAAGGPATVVPQVRKGAPVTTSMPLLLSNALASDSLLVVSGGAMSGESVTVTQAGSSAAYLSIGAIPEIPRHFGYRFERGDPILLFATSTNQAPVVTESIPNHIIQIGGSTPNLDVEEYFADPDGDALTIAARSFNETAVGVSVEGASIRLMPRNEGEALVEVSVLDPEGFRATQYSRIVVLREPDPTRFDVDIVWMGHQTARMDSLVRESSERWTRVLTGDMPDVPINGAIRCFEEVWQMSGVVDDMLVFVAFPDIWDSPGDGGGAGGPCGLRAGSSVPYMGAAWIGWAERREDADVIRTATHELGHVLGFHGEVWYDKGLLVNPTWLKGLGADTHFSGVAAREAFDAAGGTDYSEGSKVPVENVFSADHHWKSSQRRDSAVGRGVFQNELMSPFGGPYLSAVTVASFQDLGYVVDLDAADPYELYDGATAAARDVVESTQGVPFGNDVCFGPLEIRDSLGRLVRTIREGPSTCRLGRPTRRP